MDLGRGERALKVLLPEFLGQLPADSEQKRVMILKHSTITIMKETEDSRSADARH
jgi:hypothetical protein